MNSTPLTMRSPRTSGMTLMEVLIACGILIFGLSSIAALLPAAGSRLGQANLEDRAGTLAANAYTDVMTRGLVAADIFSDHQKSVAFGLGMANLPSPAFAPDQFAAPRLAMLEQRIDTNRGFLLEDELLYAPLTASATPVNEFLQGRRSFKEAVCWGATLVPHPFPAVAADLPGTKATLSIAVFRKPPDPVSIPLTLTSGIYVATNANENVAKKYLRSCGYVLVPPEDNTAGPRWFRLAASWKSPTAAGYCVAFADPAFDDFANSRTSLNVVAFDGIVRLDEHSVILE